MYFSPPTPSSFRPTFSSFSFLLPSSPPPSHLLCLAAKSVDDAESAISAAPSTQNEPIPMETKLKLPSTQPPRPAGADSRKDSAASSVSVGRGSTPTVQYKHRLSGTGGVPMYVQERLEERQRRVRTLTHTHYTFIHACMCMYVHMRISCTSCTCILYMYIYTHTHAHTLTRTTLVCTTHGLAASPTLSSQASLLCKMTE